MYAHLCMSQCINMHKHISQLYNTTLSMVKFVVLRLTNDVFWRILNLGLNPPPPMSYCWSEPMWVIGLSNFLFILSFFRLWGWGDCPDFILKVSGILDPRKPPFRRSFEVSHSLNNLKLLKTLWVVKLAKLSCCNNIIWYQNNLYKTLRLLLFSLEDFLLFTSFVVKRQR